MSLWEFIEHCQKVQRQNSTVSTSGDVSQKEGEQDVDIGDCKAYSRRVRSVFSGKQHPQYLTHEISLCNKGVVPVIVSNAIMNLEKSMEDRESFSCSVLILFKPWRHPLHLLQQYSCWMEAFDDYSFSD
ncbi:hypothetical protein BKA83DRAFT_4067481 [Pisolithus microcarpus]|nr:hypothetical protein BKA83DRAFT_4067481 [Pisolithus microcarpus]